MKNVELQEQVVKATFELRKEIYANNKTPFPFVSFDLLELL